MPQKGCPGPDGEMGSSYPPVAEPIGRGCRETDYDSGWSGSFVIIKEAVSSTGVPQLLQG